MPAVRSALRLRHLDVKSANFYRPRTALELQLCITGDALTGQLGALLGEPPDAPLDFAPAMDLATGYGQSLLRYMLAAISDLEQPDSALLNPITMGMFQQFIMTGLLLSHPHNYLEALRRRERKIAPRDVKRAIDYMEAHLRLGRNP